MRSNQQQQLLFGLVESKENEHAQKPLLEIHHLHGLSMISTDDVALATSLPFCRTMAVT